MTDTAGLPPNTATFLASWRPDGMALDCSHPPREQASRNHNDFSSALASINAIAPETAWLTHISHDFDCWEMDAAPALPHGIHIARDGELIDL